MQHADVIHHTTRLYRGSDSAAVKLDACGLARADQAFAPLTLDIASHWVSTANKRLGAELMGSKPGD
jgi:hypothetical protein